MQSMGYGDGYLYAHDYPNNFAEQEFMPPDVAGTTFYVPGENAKEKSIRSFLKERWKDKYDY